MEIAAAGEEVARWKVACELEVEAGKAAIRERDEEVLLGFYLLSYSTEMGSLLLNYQFVELFN